MIPIGFVSISFIIIAIMTLPTARFGFDPSIEITPLPIAKIEPDYFDRCNV